MSNNKSSPDFLFGDRIQARQLKNAELDTGYEVKLHNRCAAFPFEQDTPNQDSLPY